MPGATVPQGWTDVTLLLEPGLWLEIARQTLFMALTPPGAVLGLLALTAWQTPPVETHIVQGNTASEDQDEFGGNAFSHSSPGMKLT